MHVANGRKRGAMAVGSRPSRALESFPQIGLKADRRWRRKEEKCKSTHAGRTVKKRCACVRVCVDVYMRWRESNVGPEKWERMEESNRRKNETRKGVERAEKRFGREGGDPAYVFVGNKFIRVRLIYWPQV